MNETIEKLKQISDKICKKPVLLVSIGCLLLFGISGFAVYFCRVVFSPSWLLQIEGSVLLFCALLPAYFALVIAAFLLKRKPGLCMALLLFVAGAYFVFLTPPNQVPDEQTHFLRAYAMSMGDFHFDKDQQYPNDVNLLIKHFPVSYNNGYPAKEGNTIYHRFKAYKQAVQQGETAASNQVIIFQTIPYIPQAMGIFIAKIIGFGALGAYYIGRLANLAFFCLCGYFALKFSGKFKILLFTIMALPLTLFVVASHSNDAMLLGLMFLMFGVVLSDNFKIKHAVIFGVSMAVLCTSKITYGVFYLLPFAIHQEKWQVEIKNKKVKKWQMLLACFGAFFILYQGMGLYVALASNFGEIQRTMVDSDPRAQLRFILTNPLRYIVVFLDTLRNNAFFLFSGGLFGWLDVNVRLVSYFTPVIVLLNTIKQSLVLDKQDKKLSWVFFICGLLTYGVVLTGLYVTWTPVTLPQIIGLQMRYLLPAFLGFVLITAQYFSGFTKGALKNTDSSCIFTSYLFALCASGLMVLIYYFPVKAVAFVA